MQSFSDILENLINVNKEYNKLCEILEYEEILEDKKMFLFLNKKMLSIKPLIEKYHEYNKTLENVKELDTFINNENLSNNEPDKLDFIEELSNEKNKLEVLKQEITKLYSLQEAKQEEILIEINKTKDELSCELFDLLVMGYSAYLKDNSSSFSLYNHNNSVFINCCGENLKDFFETEIGTHIIKKSEQESYCYVFVYYDVPNKKYNFSSDELEITSCRSSGAGGQHINKTESSIKIVHLPTGIVGISQDERSQFQNKQKALERLKEKVNVFLESKKEEVISTQKKQQLKLIKKIVKVYNINTHLIEITNNKNQISLQDFINGKILY